jgi:hypothetical protein
LIVQISSNLCRDDEARDPVVLAARDDMPGGGSRGLSKRLFRPPPPLFVWLRSSPRRLLFPARGVA